MHQIDREAFHIKTKTNGTREEKAEAYAQLVDNQHIPHMVRVDFIGDSAAEKDFFNIDVDNGVVTVHYAPVSVQEEDNEFIEEYLEDRFGNYKSFIKEFLAVYCHSNYKKLPTLVFNSPRGNGKSTFVEMIESIYPHLSTEWNGIEGDFSYEAEKKLLIVEENDTSGVKQYKTLKKFTGQKNALVKKKYEAPYSVRNNRNIAILSNEKVPMFAAKAEMPSDEANNQFFVWEFPEFSKPINGKMLDELEARIGNYVRTELKSVFDGLKDKMSDYRYSISVPITDYEQNMFEMNITPVESEANELIDYVCYLDEHGYDQQYYEFVKEGFLPIELIKNRPSLHYSYIVSNLIERDYLLQDADRHMVNKVSLRSYAMMKKFRKKFDEAQKTKKK
jgi:hypothetical protein